MILHAPFIIGPRLLPALRVHDMIISIDYDHAEGHRIYFRYYIDGPGVEHSRADLSSPNANMQEAFASLLAFMGQPEESFPDQIVRWCEANADDIAILQDHIEQTPNLIEP